VRRVFFLLAATILAATIVAVAAAATGTPTAVGSHAAFARLFLMDGPPFALRGVGFRSDERVRIAVDTYTRDVTRTTTASASGSFTMRVAGIDANTCEGFGATAIGNKGSRATYKRVPGQCPVQ